MSAPHQAAVPLADHADIEPIEVVLGRLAPVDLEAIDGELRRRPGHDRSASYAQRMADALVELVHRARGAGREGGEAGEGSLRAAVVVLIDHADLVAGTGHGTTVDGTPVPVGEVRRLAVTEELIPVVLGAEGVPLHLGRSQRYASDAQWLALLARDGGCVLCDAPLGPLDAHHVRPWGSGGSTDVDELAPLCRRCHRHVHAAGITLEVVDGRVRAIDARGRPIPTLDRRGRRNAAARAPDDLQRQRAG